MADEDFSADDMDKFVPFASGVTVRRYTWFDEYTGTPQDCIAAGVVSADQIPGIPGHPRKLSATYRNGVLVGKGSNGQKDERYVSVRLQGKQVAIWCGLPPEVKERRGSVQREAISARRKAEGDAALMIHMNGSLAECELKLMPSDINTHRQQIIEELRTKFRSIRKHKIQNQKQGFYFDESAFEALDDMLDQMIEVVLDAEIKFDAKVQLARVQELKATIAAADPKFQRSIAAISQSVQKSKERSEA